MDQRTLPWLIPENAFVHKNDGLSIDDQPAMGPQASRIQGWLAVVSVCNVLIGIHLGRIRWDGRAEKLRFLIGPGCIQVFERKI